MNDRSRSSFTVSVQAVGGPGWCRWRRRWSILWVLLFAFKRLIVCRTRSAETHRTLWSACTAEGFTRVLSLRLHEFSIHLIRVLTHVYMSFPWNLHPMETVKFALLWTRISGRRCSKLEPLTDTLFQVRKRVLSAYLVRLRAFVWELSHWPLHIAD